MKPFPNLIGVATAVPPYHLHQAAVADWAAALFGPSFAGLRSVYPNSGIRSRYAPAPLAWFAQPHDWADRNRLYLTAATDLLERVAGRLLDRSNISPEEVGGLVVVSTTGIATPSLDALIIERLRLSRTVQRLPIFGLGCAGGAIGLARAATLAAAMPEKAVLLLAVELCTLSFRRESTKSNMVATALFGDGAAGVALRCGGPGPAIVAAGEYTWPDSLGVMGWEVARDGLSAIFSRDIPRLIVSELGGIAGDFLSRHGLGFSDIDRFVCHPGGPKVLAACECAFGLEKGALAEARAVLREFGNMSAASVLFVLDRILARARANGETWQRALITALGPGFTAGFVLLENR
jgi:alkylresorcinol/alkylpyrone synthase